nr:MAG TPA: hypothetical protein [Caudoviricetes sp.]
MPPNHIFSPLIKQYQRRSNNSQHNNRGNLMFCFPLHKLLRLFK